MHLLFLARHLSLRLTGRGCVRAGVCNRERFRVCTSAKQQHDRGWKLQSSIRQRCRYRREISGHRLGLYVPRWDPTPGLMTWVQRQRSSDLGRVVAGSSGSPGPWSLNCRARRQGQHGRSSASNACWCTGSVEGAHEVVGWPTMGRSTRLRMTWSRNTPGCPQVGHSLIGSTGSASITVTSPFSVAPVIVVPSFAVRQMVSTMTFPLGCTVGP